MSVIIPTYNNRRVLQQTIAALLAQEFPPGAYEVIIADDGSTDGTAEMVQAVRGPAPVRYVPQRNRSRAAARNLGARHARGRVLMFLDSDLWAAPVLLAEHYKHYATASRRVGVKGRSITHPDARGSLFMQVKEMGPDLTVQRTSDLSPFHVTSRWPWASITTRRPWRATSASCGRPARAPSTSGESTGVPGTSGCFWKSRPRYCR